MRIRCIFVLLVALIIFGSLNVAAVGGVTASRRNINSKVPHESDLPVGYGGTLEFCGNNSLCSVMFSDGAVISPKVAPAANCTEAYTKVIYSWRVTRREGSLAIVHVNLTLITNHIAYPGEKYLQMARNGDLSFTKRVNVSSVKVTMENESCKGCEGGFVGVIFLGNITIRRSMNVTLDIDSGLVSYNDKVLGRWVPWINVTRYHLNKFREEFLMRWLGTNLTWKVFMIEGREFKTKLVDLDEYYVGGLPFEEAKALGERGPSNESLHESLPFLMLGIPFMGNVYSPDGMLVGSSTGIYADPVLYKMGMVIIESIDEKEGMRGSSHGFELVRKFEGLKESGSHPPPGDVLAYVALASVTMCALVFLLYRRISRGPLNEDRSVEQPLSRT